MTLTEQPGMVDAVSLIRSDALRLYVSYACPWSHRVLIARALYGHADRIEVVNVEPEMDKIGWRLDDEHLIDRYRESDPTFAGRATVPLMVDRATGRIVSNESAELMRLLGTDLAGDHPPLYPQSSAVDCEAWNTRIQHDVNARVYQYGLAASGNDRAKKTAALTQALVSIDAHLAERRYLIVDDRPLEPDWLLWTTLARYDLVYRPLILGDAAPPLTSLVHLQRFFFELQDVPGIAATYRPHEIVAHYTARVRDLSSAPSPSVARDPT